jgi:hypothetical protein
MSDPQCPALLELLVDPPAPELAGHTSSCIRCRALVATVEQRVQPTTHDERAPVESHADTPAGSVTLVQVPWGAELLSVIVLGEGDDGLTVVPVSPAVLMATEWDLLLPEALVGYPAVAQVWNQGLILPEQAVETVTQTAPETLQELKRLVEAARVSAEVPTGLAVGPRVFDPGDPRLLHQDAESERALAFWEPALALAGSLTLGQLVRHRREELGVSTQRIEALAQPHGWLRDLEADTLDLPRALPATALAATMRALRVAASLRLARIARWTIEAQAPASGSALGRGSSAGRAPEVDVDGYIDEFIRDLGTPAP